MAILKPGQLASGSYTISGSFSGSFQGSGAGLNNIPSSAVVGLSSSLNVGTTLIASGTIGRVLFEGTGNVLQESANLFWDNTNARLGIGTSSPTNIVSIATNTNATEGIFLTNTSTGNLARTIFRLTNNSGNVGQLSIWGSGTGLANKTFFEATKDFVIGTDADIASGGTSRFQVYTGGFNNATSPQFTIFGTGNVAINTTTDAGFKLDVNGTARVSGTVTLNNTSGTNRSTDIRLTNSSDNFPTATFYPSSGTNVGQNFQIIPRGTGLSANIKSQLVVSGTDLIADGTNFEAMVVRATGTSFTLTTGKGGTGTIRPILLSSGFLDTVTNPNQLWLYNTGNVGINTTTDAGFRLDVNGTARVSGNFGVTVGNTISANGTGGGNGFLSGGNSFLQFSVRGLNFLTIFNGGNEANTAYQMGYSLAYNGTPPNLSALLDLTSTTKGFLPPRMTGAQAELISSPAEGLMIYATAGTGTTITSKGWWGYDGATWVKFN